VFESAISLRVMIERDKVDLSECCAELSGYSVSSVHGSNDVSHIEKRSSPA
jgi:hypothetical protein